MNYKTLPLYNTLKSKGYTSAEIVAAYTAYGEARGEGALGQQAVVDIIANRAALGKAGISTWWGRTPIETALKASTKNGRTTWQFDCWRPGTPNYRNMLKASLNDARFVRSLRVARGVLSGNYADITGGATNYLNPDPKFYKNGIRPKWYTNNLDKRTAPVEQHDFLRLTKQDPRYFRKTGWQTADGSPAPGQSEWKIKRIWDNWFNKKEPTPPVAAKKKPRYAKLPTENIPIPTFRETLIADAQPQTLEMAILAGGMDLLDYMGVYEWMGEQHKAVAQKPRIIIADPELQRLMEETPEKTPKATPKEIEAPGILDKVFNFFGSGNEPKSETKESHTFEWGETVSKLALQAGVARNHLTKYFNRFEEINPGVLTADFVLAGRTYKLPSQQFVSHLTA